ncbi:MAG TPA: phosphatase PAP2 family protein, partial [Dokdonella sp.]|nr:phosphatase PAP2 family protein [Dokdonella sp.]
SGHTLHALSFALVALAWFPMLAPLLPPFTALVATSRVVLGLHYPSDVLVASAIGFALAEASIALVRQHRRALGPGHAAASYGA